MIPFLIDCRNLAEVCSPRAASLMASRRFLRHPSFSAACLSSIVDLASSLPARLRKPSPAIPAPSPDEAETHNPRESKQSPPYPFVRVAHYLIGGPVTNEDSTVTKAQLALGCVRRTGQYLSRQGLRNEGSGWILNKPEPSRRWIDAVIYPSPLWPKAASSPAPSS